MPIRLQPGIGSNPVYLWDVSAGAETFQLPKNFSTGRKITFLRMDQSANVATVKAQSGDTLDGTVGGTATVPANGEKSFFPTDPGIWESLGTAGGGSGAVSSVAGLVGDVSASSLATAVAAQPGISGTYGPAIGSDNWLKAQASNVDVLISGAITRDGNGAATSAPVRWSDGTVGTYTGTASGTAVGAIDSYTVTYGSPATKTVTQPTLTRDASGAVTNRPALTVT